MATDPPFLEKRDGRSTEQLLSLEGEYRTDSLVLAFEDGLSTKGTPSNEELVVLAVEAIEREVNNGGFMQFFVNSSREFWPHTVSALQAIGCPDTATSMQKAIDILGVSESLSFDDIELLACEATENQDEQMTLLDDVYFEGAEEPIADKLFEYIKRNRSRIVLGS